MSGKEYLSDILFFVHQRNGMAGCNACSFSSQAAAAQGYRQETMLNGCLNFFRTEIAFGSDQDQGRFSRIIDLFYQWLFALITMSNKFASVEWLRNKRLKVGHSG